MRPCIDCSLKVSEMQEKSSVWARLQLGAGYLWSISSAKKKKILVPALPGLWTAAQPGHNSWICLYPQLYSWLEPLESDPSPAMLVDGPLEMSQALPQEVLRDFCQPQVVGQRQLLVLLVKDNDGGSIILQTPAISSAPAKWRTGEVLAKPWTLQLRCGEVVTNWTALEVFIFFNKEESFPLLSACEVVPGALLEGWGRSTRSFLKRF